MRSFNNILRNIGITTDELSTLANPQPKTYRALLTQTDTNPPSAIVLENTLGNVIWTRSAPGIFKGSNSNIIQSKSFPSQGAFSDPVNSILVDWYIMDGFIELYTYDLGEGSAADGFMPNKFPIELYVYP